MKKNYSLYFIAILLFFCGTNPAQDWHFRLKSKVELRSWSLSSRAMKNSVFLNGASVKLFRNTELINEIQTDAEGNFEMNLPPEGEYTMIISYQDQPPKKFAISTKGKSSNANDPSFKPSINMIGMIMSKHVKDAKYLGITSPHVIIEYNKDYHEKKNFHYKSGIYDAEYLLIQKFCTANKLGDLALQRKDYAQAKKFYEMALGILNTETYPKDQLAKAAEGLKTELASERTLKNKGLKKNTSQQAIISKQDKNAPVKTNVGTGKSTRKTRKVLGK